MDVAAADELRSEHQARRALVLRGRDSILIHPPGVFDADARDRTPRGLRWRVGREGKDWRLSLRLEDSHLPLPYVISG